MAVLISGKFSSPNGSTYNRPAGVLEEKNRNEEQKQKKEHYIIFKFEAKRNLGEGIVTAMYILFWVLRVCTVRF